MKWFLGGFVLLALYEFIRINNSISAYTHAEFAGDYTPYYYVYLAVLRSSLTEIAIAFLVLVGGFLYLRLEAATKLTVSQPAGEEETAR